MADKAIKNLAFLLTNVTKIENVSIYSPYITMSMCSTMSGCMLHFSFTIFFCNFCVKNAEVSNFFPIFQVFDDSIDKEIGTKEGLGARGLRIVVWCQLENILTY